MRRGVPLLAIVALAALVFPVTAEATWPGEATGSSYAGARTMPAGNQPEVEVSGRNAILSWQPSEAGVPVDGYILKRYTASGQAQAPEGGCAGLVLAATCEEQALPPGEWAFSITPVRGGWRGTESKPSPLVTIASPSLSLDAESVSSPGALSGQLNDFAAGQSVAFRLDDPVAGPTLTASIAPDPVPDDGTAEVSVSLPGGVSSGLHTIYAIGDWGDVASAEISVDTQMTTVTTPAWSLQDASSGVAADNSDPSAFSADGRASETRSFDTGFSTTEYVAYVLNSPLPSGLTASSVAFNFNFAPVGNTDTACIYLAAYSDGSPIGTHGSPGSPLSCKTDNTGFQQTSTPLPEVTGTTTANGLEVRVYATNTGGGALSVDLATASVTVNSGQTFTLYETTTTDVRGKHTYDTPWPLDSAADDAFYTSSESWGTGFDTSRYLSLSFPSYVPAGAKIESATLVHSYRSAQTKADACYYFEVYSGATLLASHGSAESPLSCNSSKNTWTTDEVPLPEVATATEADELSVKLRFESSKSRASEHDLAELQVTYAP